MGPFHAQPRSIFLACSFKVVTEEGKRVDTFFWYEAMLQRLTELTRVFLRMSTLHHEILAVKKAKLLPCLAANKNFFSVSDVKRVKTKAERVSP